MGGMFQGGGGQMGGVMQGGGGGKPGGGGGGGIANFGGGGKPGGGQLPGPQPSPGPGIPGIGTSQPGRAVPSPPQGGNPLNPVPSWYGGNMPYRGADHPSHAIGRGVQRPQQSFSLRNMNRPPMPEQAVNPNVPDPVAS